MERKQDDFGKFSGATSESSLAHRKHEPQRHDVTALIEAVLPRLRSYLVRRLNMAHATGALSKSDLPAEEILNEVYLQLFERVEPTVTPDALTTWAYQVADHVLEEALHEKRFERKHRIHLDQLALQELASLDEVYTVDAEGTLVMADELDEAASIPRQYDLERILKDEAADQEMERALASYDRSLLHKAIRRELLQLPELERTVFDLFWLEELELSQVAEIRRLTTAETERILAKVTQQLKEKLERRLQASRS